jgi:hypothetical protein
VFVPQLQIAPLRNEKKTSLDLRVFSKFRHIRDKQNLRRQNDCLNLRIATNYAHVLTEMTIMASLAISALMKPLAFY